MPSFLNFARLVVCGLLAVVLGVCARAQHQPRTVEDAMRVITKSFKAKTKKSDVPRKISFDIKDWPEETTRFVKISKGGIPVLGQAGLANSQLNVVAITKPGEIFAFDGRYQIVELMNPLGGGVDGSGYWYKVHGLDGKAGWLYASRGSNDVPLFGTVFAKPSPPSTGLQVGGTAILLIFFLCFVCFFILRNAKETTGERRPSSDGYGGYDGSAGFGTGSDAGAGTTRSGLPMYQAVSSREVDGLTGRRTEHYDEGGHKIGESRVRDGVMGKYVEHYDERGKKTGESRVREGLSENYVEHSEKGKGKVGESHKRESWFGLDTFTEHTDKEGEKTGESRKEEGWFGDIFTIHKQKDD